MKEVFIIEESYIGDEGEEFILGCFDDKFFLSKDSAVKFLNNTNARKSPISEIWYRYSYERRYYYQIKKLNS